MRAAVYKSLIFKLLDRTTDKRTACTTNGHVLS